MSEQENRVAKNISILAMVVSIVAGTISIAGYLKPDEYMAEGKFNNSNDKIERYDECVDGDTMQSCEVSYISDMSGVVNNFPSGSCSVAEINRTRSKHKCEIPEKVDVDNAHKCHVVAVCKRN